MLIRLVRHDCGCIAVSFLNGVCVCVCHEVGRIETDIKYTVYITCTIPTRP